jgi:hypothetical protein
MSHNEQGEDVDQKPSNTAPQGAGMIVAGTEAQNVVGKGHQPETRTEDEAQDDTATIVAGPKAHEVESQDAENDQS